MTIKATPLHIILKQNIALPPVDRLPLETGDHLSQAEFHRRYKAHPEIKKAELVGGVVYIKNQEIREGTNFMASPVRIRQHSIPHRHLMTWTGLYEAETSGIFGGDNGSVILDSSKNEVQPDGFLAIETAAGGQSIINEDDYLEGAPELIIEVAASSVSYDMHSKKQVYAAHGVQEYIVAQVYERQLVWFRLRHGKYEELKSDEVGVLRSEVFPGLWLDAEAFWSGDLAQMLAVLQNGMATEDHAAYVATRLNKLRK